MKKFFVFIFITLTILNCRKTGIDVSKQTEKGENIEFIQAPEENVLNYEGNYNIFGSKEVRLDSPAENKFIGAINDYSGYAYIAVYEKYILFEKQKESEPGIIGKIYKTNN
jgi:hypothetical protein